MITCYRGAASSGSGPRWSAAALLVLLVTMVSGGASASARLLSPDVWLLAPDSGLQSSDDPRLDAARERLEEARRSMQEAVREIAELTAPDVQEPIIRLRTRLARMENRAMLGINIADSPRDSAGDDPRSTAGVQVLGVSPNGPAAKAGIAAGDVIVALNGQPLGDGTGRSPEAVLFEIMRALEPGDPVAVRFLRDGAVSEVTAIASRFDELRFDWLDGMLQSLRAGDLAKRLRLTSVAGFRDLELAPISPQLGAYFGATEGLLVVRAPRDGALGVQDGDVILRIDGQRPDSSAHALRLLGGSAGGTVTLEVLRHGKRFTSEVRLPPPGRDSRWSLRLESD